MKHLTIAIITLAMFSSTWAVAQDADNKDQPAQAQEQQDPNAKVTVESVEGSAEYAVIKEGQDTKWTAIKAKASLPANAVIRTGFRTKVVLQFPDGSKVTIDRATKVGLTKLKSSQGKGKTEVGLKYGTIRAEVKEGQKQGDFKVVTPVATLSVSGSKAEIGYSIDNCMGVKVQKGNWQIQKYCSSTLVSDGEWGDCYLTNYLDLVDARWDSYMADGLGLTDEDKKLDRSKGRGRGWIAIPGSPWTVDPTRLKKKTAEVVIVNP